MTEINAVLGQAGTGKTTWLMQKTAELAPRFLTAEHHSVLAITRMHGSRRQLQMKLQEFCPSIRCQVTTIDGFALTILNRWRTALGYSRPIQPVSDDVTFTDTIFGTEAGFSHIAAASSHLLQSNTIKALIRQTYPLVMIDEFQDCHGPLLDFVKAISTCSALVVAADDFQLLDATVNGCPAVEWVQAPGDDAVVQCTHLSICHRTSAQHILDAARCVRENVQASTQTITVVCCPSHGPAAFKIVEALVYKANDWQGTTAVICPSHDPFLNEVLDSCNNQLQKKNREPMSWLHESSAQVEEERIRNSLGLTAWKGTTPGGWTVPSTELDPVAAQVVTRTRRFSRLRGIDAIPHDVVARHVDAVVHERRAYGGPSPKRIVTTVHGAKNREFDNVIILWPYTVPSDGEQKRRLLYNAITRSKKNCMLLVRGNLNRAQSDPVLALLGPAQNAFSAKGKKT